MVYEYILKRVKIIFGLFFNSFKFKSLNCFYVDVSVWGIMWNIDRLMVVFFRGYRIGV